MVREERLPIFQRDPGDALDTLERARRAPDLSDERAFVAEQGLGYSPAAVQRSDEVIAGDEHVHEERVAERERAAGGEERLDGQAGGLHVDEQEADASLLPGLRIGAHQSEDPVGILGVGRPRLLPVHDEVPLAIILGARREGSQIRSGVGLGVALAPDLFAGEDLRQESLLLRLGAELDEEWADRNEAQRGQQRAAGELELLREDEAMGHVEAGPAVLDGPMRRDPTLLVKDPVPLHDLLVLEVAVNRGLFAQLGGQVGADEFAHLLAEREVLRAEGEIHRDGE